MGSVVWVSGCCVMPSDHQSHVVNVSPLYADIDLHPSTSGWPCYETLENNAFNYGPISPMRVIINTPSYEHNTTGRSFDSVDPSDHLSSEQRSLIINLSSGLSSCHEVLKFSYYTKPSQLATMRRLASPPSSQRQALVPSQAQC